jgi:hypothetical protein
VCSTSAHIKTCHPCKRLRLHVALLLRSSYAFIICGLGIAVILPFTLSLVSRHLPTSVNVVWLGDQSDSSVYAKMGIVVVK